MLYFTLLIEFYIVLFVQNFHRIMTLKTSLILLQFYFIFIFSAETDFIANHSISIERDFVLSKIISNFLNNFFRNQDIYLSIIIPSVKQNYLQMDFLTNFLSTQELSTHGFSIQNKICNLIYKRGRAFNLILINDCESLR